MLTGDVTIQHAGTTGHGHGIQWYREKNAGFPAAPDASTGGENQGLGEAEDAV